MVCPVGQCEVQEGTCKKGGGRERGRIGERQGWREGGREGGRKGGREIVQ